MSDVIKLLPDYVANQIAAGEVVQRPSSVVKELLENSVDANASFISLIIEEAGRTLIQIEDNGNGMSATDARLSFERHATSKIRNTEDIFRILTKGFRGEALASIAAVAKVEMKTMRASDKIGTNIIIEGGKFVIQEAIASPIGTIISVRNLFYNVPARRSFLKSNSVEFRNILDEYHRLVLSHPDIEFKLTHNNSLVYHNRKGSFLQRILQIFGHKQEGFLTPISEQTSLVDIEGFVGKPDISKKSKGLQFIFINNRYIKSPLLHKAISQAFGNLLPAKHHPAYFIKLKMDPSKIDINIHPTKTEVKFIDEHTLFAVLNATIKRSLGKFQVRDAIDFNVDNNWDFPTSNHKPSRNSGVLVSRDFNPFERKITGTKVDFDSLNEIYLDHVEKNYEPNTEQLDFDKSKTNWEVLSLEKGLILTFYKGELLIINQNRAHQTIIFNEFLEKFSQNNISQKILIPVEIPINSSDKIQLESYGKELIEIGFDYTIEKELLIITALPSSMKIEQTEKFFEEIFDNQEEDSILKISHKIQLKLAKIMSKVCAVKRTDILGKVQLEHLLSEFFKLEEVQYSPFGKVNYNKIELESLTKNLY